MSKKLLSEAQVRRFQALATIKPINEMAYNEEEKVEETYNEELVNEEEEVEMEAAPEAGKNEAEKFEIDLIKNMGGEVDDNGDLVPGSLSNDTFQEQQKTK